MNVKELMTQVDADRVTDAYMLLDYSFSEENFENTLIEKHKSIPKLREAVKKNIQLLAECDIKNDAERYTIFIILTPSDDYEEQHRKELTAFAICDGDALKVVDKDFHIFDNKGEASVPHYGFDDAPIHDMANYTIAQSSLDELGAEICAAKILSELFYWGVLPEQREKNIKELYEQLSKPTDKKEFVDIQTFEEVMRKYEDELLSDMTDDERIYHDAKKRFEEATEGVVRCHWQKVKEEIHMQYIKAIKEEYLHRKEIKK